MRSLSIYCYIFVVTLQYVDSLRISELLRVYSKELLGLTKTGTDLETLYAAIDKRNHIQSLKQSTEDEKEMIKDGSLTESAKRNWPFKSFPLWPSTNSLPIKSNSVPNRYPAQLRVTIDGRASNRHAYSMIGITLSPRMTVFDALFMAHVRYHRIHRFQSNPFDVELEWDDVRGCEVITWADGIENTNEHEWKIVLQRRRNDDRCLLVDEAKVHSCKMFDLGLIEASLNYRKQYFIKTCVSRHPDSD